MDRISNAFLSFTLFITVTDRISNAFLFIALFIEMLTDVRSVWTPVAHSPSRSQSFPDEWFSPIIIRNT